MESDNNNHSVFLMYYHLVLVVKYRKTVINEAISNRLKEIFEYISPNYNIAYKNGITIKTMYISCSKLTLIRNYQSSSMPTKAPHPA